MCDVSVRPSVRPSVDPFIHLSSHAQPQAPLRCFTAEGLALAALLPNAIGFDKKSTSLPKQKMPHSNPFDLSLLVK